LATLKKQAITGILWSGVQMVVNQGSSFIIKLVLARLLFPEQFGLVGMATVFIGFVQVFNDLGIGAALIQRKDEDIREAHFHTAFWTGVGWAFFMYVVIYFVVAPFAAHFYEEPILKNLIPVLGLGILSSPVNLVHKAQLTKKMNFKRIAIIDNTANLTAGGLSLALAFAGAGVWSLAFNSVASIVIAMPLFFMATKWKPKLLFEKQAFKEVFGFGIYTTGTNITNYLINNVDYLLIGKLLSAQALGAYTFAFILTDTFRSRLMSVMNSVLYPLYSKMQDNPQSLKNHYLKVVEYNSIVVFPIMLFFIAFADTVIIPIFGDKWVEAVVPLKILSLAVMVHMMVNSNTALIRGLGKPGLEMKLQVLKAVIFLPLIYLGVRNYGLIGAAGAILLNKIIAVIIAQYTFKKLLTVKIDTAEFLHAIKFPWLSSMITYFAVFVMLNYLGVHFMVAAVFLFVVYGILIYIFSGKELKKQFAQVKQLKRV
jgi:teichuronic acid exporter